MIDLLGIEASEAVSRAAAEADVKTDSMRINPRQLPHLGAPHKESVHRHERPAGAGADKRRKPPDSRRQAIGNCAGDEAGGGSDTEELDAETARPWVRLAGAGMRRA